jgi:CubicO group peptidase (beta-lactamase class C family)
MQQFSTETQTLIKKFCKGKTHIKLAIGTLANAETNFSVFGANGAELPYENYTYEIGSMTKNFMGLLLAKYIHEGKMSLDDSISKYVDGLDSSKY